MAARSASFSIYALIDPHNMHTIVMERRAMLAHFSMRIEVDTLTLKLSSPVYAGFQKIDYTAPVLRRYQKMAALGADVWLFGTATERGLDVQPCRTIALQPTDALAREWFLVVHDPLYSRALVAREMTEPGTPHPQRIFEGVVTTRPRSASLPPRWEPL